MTQGGRKVCSEQTLQMFTAVIIISVLVHFLVFMFSLLVKIHSRCKPFYISLFQLDFFFVSICLCLVTLSFSLGVYFYDYRLFKSRWTLMAA